MLDTFSHTTKSVYNHLQIGVYTLFACVCFSFFPVQAHAEYIESFVSDIQVYADSTFHVTETITYIFDTEKHGIFRCIPTIHPENVHSLFKERYIDIEFHSVSMDGDDVPYTKKDSRKESCLQIGDPHNTITGKRVYEFTYTVKGAISYPQYGGAELYYNVTGSEWPVGILNAEARVSSPSAIMLRERACYRGRSGATGSCKSVTEENGTVVFRDGLLDPGQGMTIAQAVNRSIITEDIRIRYKIFMLVCIGLVVGLSALGIVIYRYKTKFKTGNTIIPQYEPYPGVKPMYAGFLFDKKLDSRDIAAGLVYLAKEGFIKIRKIDRKVFFFFEVDDYEIELLKKVTDVSDPFEQKILTLIFSTDSEVGTKSSLTQLKESHARGVKNAEILQELQKTLAKDLKSQGYFTGFDFTSADTKFYAILISITSAALLFLSQGFLIPIGIGLFVLYSIFAEGRRTHKGYEALDHLKGFKTFLSVTEKERYIFHNAPEKNAEQFMEYLPYAIAFGVEKEWSKTFESLTIQNPDWYDGGAGTHTFNALALSNSLGGFSTAFASSSGTGGSASSGGGSSGGGSGGGGGGSW